MDEPDRPKRYARDFKVGDVIWDYTDPESGLRALVARGTFALVAYVGVQADHTLAELEDFDFRCHGDITWRAWGEGECGREQGWYWWGWDYGHAFDRPHFDLPAHLQAEMDAMLERIWKDSPFKPKDWTVEEVCDDAVNVLVELKEALAHSAELAQLALPKAKRPA